ncbi:MAG: hypothetical protein GY847_19195 [Proteobacteria bacterium]|nr:hypothetical protein [Pseudomonadota bacterium]
MALKEQKSLVLSIYPFLDDETVRSCIEYMQPVVTKFPMSLNHDLVREAFHTVSTDIISARFPGLPAWQLTEISEQLIDLSTSSEKNCFGDLETVERIYDGVTKLPSSSEDVNDILISLQGERDIDIIRTKLLKIIIYIRTEKKNLHSAKTTEGDNVVAVIEQNLIDFLDTCTKKSFYSIYSTLRELVTITPKSDVLGININELRENVAFYDENRPDDNPFCQIAEDIREAVHRRLSGEVINLIDELISFLESEEEWFLTSGRYCKATKEEKKIELESELFKKLLAAREQLKLIWNDPFHLDAKTFSSSSRTEETKKFIDTSVEMIKKTTAPFEDIIKPYDRFRFWEQLHQTIEALENGYFQKINLGPTRYSLNRIILDFAGLRRNVKGRLLLNLMTLDCILENISLIYYSNIVNSELATVNDTNFHEAVKILPDLVMCARSTGQGTKAMRTLALSMEKYIKDNREIGKVEVQSFIREMNEELLSYIYKSSQSMHCLIDASTWHRRLDDIKRVHAQLLNDMIREKTTHLCGNLLSSIGRFLGGEGSEDTRKLANIKRSSQRDDEKEEIDLNDVVFRFGQDIENISHVEEDVWFMGGKGTSEVGMSLIIVNQALRGVDVPKGFGLSTLTWTIIKRSPEKQRLLEEIVRDEIEILERRTGKRFGDASNLLILVARSGAIVSMPGVLPTITHIGLNEEIVEKWATVLDQPYRAYHAYLRFLFSYSETVFRDLGVVHESIYRGLDTRRIAELCVKDIEQLRKTIKKVKRNIYMITGGLTVPDDCHNQLLTSIHAVLSSYERAEVVSHHHEMRSIPPEYQTACLIQHCLPILGDNDCSGVYITRNPLDGGDGQIEYIHDFGEDLADGRVRPGSSEKFRKSYPIQSERLEDIGKIIEKKYTNPMDIEFSIRDGELNILQTRPLTLAPMVNVVANYRMYLKGLISDSELVKRTRRIAGHPLINTFLEEISKHNNTPITFGQPIAGGVVAGRIIFDQKNIEKYPDEHIIFITKSNVPREVTLQSGIDGYISEEGGVTSHAALVSIGKLPCIVGVKWSKFGNSIFLDEDVEIMEGDIITLDANEGYIYKGELPILESPEDNPEYLEAEKAILDIIKRLEEYTIMPAPPTE